MTTTDLHDEPTTAEPIVRGIYSRVSGVALDQCDVLAGRYDEDIGYRPPDAETWVVRFSPGDRIDTLFLKAAGWLTGIWRSTSGRIFVTDIDRKVHHYDPAANQWAAFALDANLTGVWGLDDTHVFTWGLGQGSAPVVFSWDGHGWRQIEAPGQIIGQMHGLRPDLVFAVGDSGMIARWDGVRWTTMASSATGTLTSVFVVSDDEAYACGTDRELLAGSVHGWTKVLDAEVPLYTVARWRGDVYVGASLPLGLCKLDGRALVQVAPPIQALDLDARGSLLVATNGYVAESTDGKTFTGRRVESFEDLVRDDPPTWR